MSDLQQFRQNFNSTEVDYITLTFPKVVADKLITTTLVSNLGLIMGIMAVVDLLAIGFDIKALVVVHVHRLAVAIPKATKLGEAYDN